MVNRGRAGVLRLSAIVIAALGRLSRLSGKPVWERSIVFRGTPRNLSKGIEDDEVQATKTAPDGCERPPGARQAFAPTGPDNSLATYEQHAAGPACPFQTSL
jgi:hypothetical protein